MLYYVNEVKNLIKDNESYPKLMEWQENFPAVKIPECINSFDAFRVIRTFAKEAGLDKDKILALTSFLVGLIPLINEPKAVADYSVDFNGVYDFQFTIDDLMDVLKNKKPTSCPKHDSKKKKYIPEYKQVKIAYTFGLEYNPKSKLMRLRYKLYPQKQWWGFRYEERLRSFEDLLDFVSRDLLQYYHEEQAEISVPVEDLEPDEDSLEAEGL